MDISESIKIEIKERFEDKDTDKAWYVKLPDGFYWLPKSRCKIIGKYIYIPKWLADSKEINY
jgi:hypothetical protein